MKTEQLLTELLTSARAAAEVVMRVYAESDPGVEMKGPDDPVTRADREANAVLLELLAKAFPGIPIVAEESDPSAYHGFEAERAALFVDPVDGTREFIAKNGEFGVMIGYAEDGLAKATAIVCPAVDETYVAVVGEGAFRVTPAGRIPIRVTSTARLEDARAAITRSHRTPIMDRRLAGLGLRALVPLGSGALKAGRLASGAFDLFGFPLESPMKLWDMCATDALVRAAGGMLTDARGVPFDYRGAFAQGAGVLATNGKLHAEAVRRFGMKA